MPVSAQKEAQTPFEAFQHALELAGRTANMTPGDSGVQWEASIPVGNELNFSIAATNLHKFRVGE